MVYFKGYYQIELLRRASQDGMSSFLRACGMMVRRTIVGRYSLVYVLSRSDAMAPPVGEFNDGELLIRSYRSWAEIEDSLKRTLLSEKRHIFWDVEQWLVRGARLWVATIDGHLAAVLFNRDPVQPGAFFFPLTSGCGLIWNAVTLPEFRGRGIYPIILRATCASLFDEGKESIFVSCDDYNRASIRGIEKVGFRHIGTGIIFRGSKKGLWKPQIKPCQFQ